MRWFANSPQSNMDTEGTSHEKKAQYFEDAANQKSSLK